MNIMKKLLFLLLSVFTLQVAQADNDKHGEWTELDCKRSSVPTKAVPAQITKFVKESHPNATILKLERDRYTYEVKLSNFWEIKFDKQFNVIDMDMDD